MRRGAGGQGHGGDSASGGGADNRGLARSGCPQRPDPAQPRPLTTDPASAEPRPSLLRRRLRQALLAIGGAVLLAVVVLAAAVAWYTPRLPSLDPVIRYQPRQPLQVLTADGEPLAQFGAEKRQFVPIGKIPLLLQQAVLAVEDSRFREHGGIDLRGLARALLANLSGGMRQGASTITQQVARTFFLSQRFTPERKLKEALLALEIERRLSKDQILELYLNQIYLGQRAYGFAAAASTYFDKPLEALSIAEVALLAGLPQNPAYANPITNLDRALQRQHVVLARMVATGVIDAAQQARARAEKLVLRAAPQQTLHGEHVAEMARRLVVERFGAEAYSQGIRVVTSLRAVDQQAAYAALRRGVLAYDARQPWRGPEDTEQLPPDGSADLERAAAQALKDYDDDDTLRLAIVLSASPREVLVQLASGERLRIAGEGLRLAQPGLASRAPAALAIRRGAVLRVIRGPGKGSADSGGWSISQFPEVDAALVSIDPADGRVRALVGGFSFSHQPFNHVTQAWRQPGSAFKPFVYSAALEDGVMPATLVDDAPYTAPDGWQPQNSDGRYDGPITLRQALARSKNLVSVRLLQHIGVPPVLAWARRFGFDPARQPANLTLALGAGSTTPLQLAQAYAVLANGGFSVAPVLIERITDAQGQVLFEAPKPPPPDARQRVVPQRNVFVTDSLLNDVTRIGTAARAQQQLGRPDLYGKTGTTNEAVDAWFAGFQPTLVAVAWMGHDQPRSLGASESGGGLALPIWIDYMAQALKGVAVAAPPEAPEGLVREGGDWVYAELAGGGAVAAIGVDAAAAAAAASALASAAAAAASAVATPPLAPPAVASASSASSAAGR